MVTCRTETLMAKRLKAVVESVGGVVHKDHQSGMGDSGWPDIFVGLRENMGGLHVTKQMHVELKMDKKLPTVKQYGRLAKLRQAGCKAGVLCPSDIESWDFVDVAAALRACTRREIPRPKEYAEGST